MRRCRRTTDPWWVPSTTATSARVRWIWSLASPPEMLLIDADVSPIDIEQPDNFLAFAEYWQLHRVSTSIADKRLRGSHWTPSCLSSAVSTGRRQTTAVHVKALL